MYVLTVSLKNINNYMVNKFSFPFSIYTIDNIMRMYKNGCPCVHNHQTIRFLNVMTLTQFLKYPVIIIIIFATDTTYQN